MNPSKAATTVSPNFSARAIGTSAPGLAWITDLTIADLDQDGRRDIIAGEGRLNTVSWIRQTRVGVYEEEVIGQAVGGPAHVEAVDLDRDGDLDVLVASMGSIAPNNDKLGAVVVLENDGTNHFRNRVLLENSYRVSYVGAADLDGDGDLDLSVGQFGYLEGQVQWMENRGGWNFVVHPLLAVSGCIHAPVADLNSDGYPDVVALMSQDWEEVHAFDNQGGGQFVDRILYGSTNKDYGSSGLVVADLDRDGDPDLIYTNGDAFDYATPGPRPWHGAQWLENDGRGRFSFRRIGNLSGCYSPLVADLDGDGDLDVTTVSAFNDWSQENLPSLVCFVNDGAQRFSARVLATNPTHLIVVKGADMDGDGDIDLVTGGLNFHPPYRQPSRVTLWEQQSGAAR